MKDREDTGVRGAASDVGQRMDRAEPVQARRRASGREEDLKSKRRELSRITNEVLRAAKRGAERSEQLEQVKRAKRKQQEIFRLKSGLRATQEGSGAVGTGALPDFVVIGAPKCGTTFFYHLLTEHPDVEPAACKEVGYFDLLFEEGIDWYRHCFPSPRWEDGRRIITGEATPSYLYNPLVPERMAEAVPQARLIALLRDPVDRTLSAYHHRVRSGKETRTFEETLDAAFNVPNHGHLSHAVYVDYLLRWSKFFSAGQVLVLKSEDLSESPRETLKRVLDFLDLPDWEPEDSVLLDKRNKGGYEDEMDPAIRRRLEDYFEPHNRRLYDHLGVDFGW